METKEAIEFMNQCKEMNFIWNEKVQNWKAKEKCSLEVIELLQRGEKFEKMWGKLFLTTHDGGYEFKRDVRYHVAGLMKNIKQEYFPK